MTRDHTQECEHHFSAQRALEFLMHHDPRDNCIGDGGEELRRTELVVSVGQSVVKFSSLFSEPF